MVSTSDEGYLPDINFDRQNPHSLSTSSLLGMGIDMSTEIRRNSLRKSSIGIKSIRKSITNLSEGLASIRKQSSELLKETRKSNLLKSKLIRQDAEFFKRREKCFKKTKRG